MLAHNVRGKHNRGQRGLLGIDIFFEGKGKGDSRQAIAHRVQSQNLLEARKDRLLPCAYRVIKL